MNFLKHLQSQSPDIKAYYALGIAGVTTGLIAIVWISTLPARFAEITPDEKSFDDESSSLTELMNDTKNQLGTVIEGVKEFENIDPATIIETNNMDNLSMDEIPSDSEHGVSESPAPSGTEIKPVAEPAEQKKEISNGAPRVILIGTTTSQRAE